LFYAARAKVSHPISFDNLNVAMEEIMRQVSVNGVAVLGAILFVGGLLSPGTVVSGRATAQEPPADIKIIFRGLMVFDQPRSRVQVVRLHNDAEHHNVNIRIYGPSFPDGVDWGRDLPKGTALQFDIVAEPPLSPSAKWDSGLLLNINKDLHKNSTSNGDFGRKPNGLGPIFTLNAGTFFGRKPADMNFVSILSPDVEKKDISTFVEATIDLKGGQIGCLTGDYLDPFWLLEPRGDVKWTIVISNEPDYNHVCDYHFRQYYKAFEYTKTGPVNYLSQYEATTKSMSGPCDTLHAQPLTLDEVRTTRQEEKAIPTRPCIPITY
jgi:hypothetical protein